MGRRLAAIATLLLTGMLLMPDARAVSSPTLFVTHPSIAAQPDIGRGIDDMAVKDGRLYLGYGDYSANTGPIDIAYVDLASGAPGVSLYATPTEEINTYRSFRGYLFTPWVDPTGWGESVNPPNGGMNTDEGGAWHREHTFPAGHIYDYAELGDDRFLAGAIAYGGAGVWQSRSGGAWELVREENSPGGTTGWERFYWAITLRGKVYVQAKHKGGTSTLPDGAMFDMWSYDGSRWRKERASVDGITAGHQIEVYKNRAYYRGGVFDGGRTVRNDVPIMFVRDWYNDGTFLYAVGDDGSLARTDGSGWESLGQMVLPDEDRAYSVAVHDGYAYVGTRAGLVYRSAL